MLRHRTSPARTLADWKTNLKNAGIDPRSLPIELEAKKCNRIQPQNYIVSNKYLIQRDKISLTSKHLFILTRRDSTFKCLKTPSQQVRSLESSPESVSCQLRRQQSIPSFGVTRTTTRRRETRKAKISGSANTKYSGA